MKIILIVVAALAVTTLISTSIMFPKAKALSETKFDYETKQLTITYDNKTLYGELLVPEDGINSLVICCHGFGSSYKSPKSNIGETLALSGYSVYVFDFCGGSSSSKSSMDMTEMSVLTEADDLNAVVDYFEANADYDNLYLLGESQGGFVSAMVAAKRSDDIKALILEYPAFCAVDDAHAGYATIEDIPQYPELMARKIGKIYYTDMWDLDVYEAIKGYTGNVLLLHGDKDNIVNIAYSDKANEVYEHCEYYVLIGQGHGFKASSLTTTREYIYDFLERN